MNDKPLLTSKSPSNINKSLGLTPHLCSQTFMNVLRQNNNKVHNEHKIIKVRKRIPNKRNQVSHVFTGESVFPRSHVTHVHVSSQILFNDDYFEFNPTIKKERLMRYKVEKEMKSRPHLYADEFYLPEDRKYALQQKIQDYYSRNPLSTQIEPIDQQRMTRMANRTENLQRCNSSIQMKRSLRNLRHNSIPTEPLSKITNDQYQYRETINQSQENKGKKHFRDVSVGNNRLMYC